MFIVRFHFFQDNMQERGFVASSAADQSLVLISAHPLLSPLVRTCDMYFRSGPALQCISHSVSSLVGDTLDLAFGTFDISYCISNSFFTSLGLLFHYFSFLW